MATSPLTHENVWVLKPQYDKAERLHYERLAKYGLHTKNRDGITRRANRKTSIQADTWTLPNSNPSTNLPCQKSNKKNKTIPAPSDQLMLHQDIVEAIANNADDSSHDSKNLKPKEAKEKKNKAYKQHEDESDMKCINVQSNVEEYLPRTVQGGPQYSCPIAPAPGSLASEVAKARQHIKESLKCVDSIAAFAGGSSPEIVSRVAALEKENTDLKNIVAELKSVVTEVKIFVGRLDQRINVLESSRLPPGDPGYIAVCPVKPPSSQAKQPAKAAAKNDDDDDDDDVDLFGSDSEGEDVEAAKIRDERLAAYAAKKSNKPVLIAKSNIILDVKPWDDETDMKQMEVEVRKVETDGLLWGAAKLVPLAYGIHKLQISCVVEDDKVSVDWLTEQLEAIEDFVQSVDIAAFNKV